MISNCKGSSMFIKKSDKSGLYVTFYERLIGDVVESIGVSVFNVERDVTLNQDDLMRRFDEVIVSSANGKMYEDDEFFGHGFTKLADKNLSNLEKIFTEKGFDISVEKVSVFHLFKYGEVSLGYLMSQYGVSDYSAESLMCAYKEYIADKNQVNLQRVLAVMSPTWSLDLLKPAGR